jgi:intein-encoded DNA endonuclease-like protein
MHISPTENTTNLPRKDEYPDRLMLPAQTEIRAQKYSPFEVRARLCARVLELTKLSMSYQQIQTEIFESTHIRLSKGSISGWVRGIHNPSGGKNKFRAVASPELAYVIGVIAGDGNLSVHGYNYEMLLSITDYDFAEEFSRCLAKILGKSNLYKVRWSEKRKRWIVQGSSIILHRFLSKPWQHLKNHIEHSSRCRFSFLRALFDGEGSITGRNLTISNTDLSLLLYVRKLLCQERNLNEDTACHTQSWFDSQGPEYGQNLQKAKRLLRNACFTHRSTAICPKDRLFDRTKKEGTSILC